MKDFSLDYHAVEQIVNYKLVIRNEKMYVKCRINFTEIPDTYYVIETKYDYRSNEDIVTELYDIAWNILKEDYYDQIGAIYGTR